MSKNLIKRAVPKMISWLTPSIIKNLKIIAVPVADVGMDMKLWGFTLWLVSFMLQMGLNNLPRTDPCFLEVNSIIKRIESLQL